MSRGRAFEARPIPSRELIEEARLSEWLRLSKRDVEMLEQRRIPLSYKRMGEIHGISPERVRQVVARAMRAVRVYEHWRPVYQREMVRAVKGIRAGLGDV